MGQRQDGQIGGDPGAVVARGRSLRHGGVGEGRTIERAQVDAPVPHDRETIREQVQDQGGSCTAQM